MPRSCSSTTWEMSRIDYAAGVIGFFARTVAAMPRYPARSTCALSRTRGRRGRPRGGRPPAWWASARLRACCSRRSMPKISARMGSCSGEEPSMTAVISWTRFACGEAQLEAARRPRTRAAVRKRCRAPPDRPRQGSQPGGGDAVDLAVLVEDLDLLRVVADADGLRPQGRVERRQLQRRPGDRPARAVREVEAHGAVGGVVHDVEHRLRIEMRRELRQAG